MKSNFWLIYLNLAVILGVATWVGAPKVGEKLSPNARRQIREMFGMRTYAGDAAQEAADIAEANRRMAEVAAADAARKDAIARRDDNEVLPSKLGIVQADPRTAAWGVLNQVTVAELLDNTPYGKIKGGRFLVIEGRATRDDGLYLIGNFTPKKLGESVQVPAANVYCFTGDPMKLSERQRECLRMYYELRGDAEELKKQLLREFLERSPHFRAELEAVKEFREKAKKIENAKDATTEEKRQAAYELSQLRTKVHELNEKHKEWKKAHEGEAPKPEEHEGYKEIMKRQRRYVKAIPGMTF